MLCRDLGLVDADRYGNPVFVRGNAASEATGIETVTAAARDPRKLSPNITRARLNVVRVASLA